MSHGTVWSCAQLEQQVFGFLRGELELAEQLRAQAHVETCPACQAMVGQWGAWSQTLSAATAQPLSKEHAATLLRQVLAQDQPIAGGRLVSGVAFTRHRIVWAAAAAAVVLVVTSFFTGFGQRDQAPSALIERPILGAHLEGQELSLAHDATAIELGRVTLKPSARGRVHVEQGGTRSPLIALDAGRVQVEVEPLGAGQELRVCTDLTCVRVIGTGFVLTRGAPGVRDSVQVEHGVVAVSARASPDVEIVLHAGEDFVVPWADPTYERPTPAPVEVSRCPASLDAAKIALGGRRDAHCIASPELWMSVGEAFLARADRHNARWAFTEVTRRFAASSQADSAAYSLAVLALDDGELSDAERRFEGYLSAHPRGEFADDARWRLATLAVRTASAVASTRLQDVCLTSPSSSRRAEASFLLGSIYEREPGSRAAARRAYERVLGESGASSDLRRRATTRLEELR